MEEKHEDTIELKCPRKLNFNAPLLSIRRLGNSTGLELSCANYHQGSSWNKASERIPFSWEQAPGKPKELQKNSHIIINDDPTPSPKLPPGWWRPPIEDHHHHHHDYRHCHHHDHDDGFDGDIDDLNNNHDDDDDSDAMDVHSLSEAIDIVERAEKANKLKSSKLKLEEEDEEEEEDGVRSENHSPNFMLERFLPDATAVAASSVMNHWKNMNRNFPDSCYSNYKESYVSRSAVIKQPFSPLKGCGLDNLLPWKMKHRLCSLKSPIREASVNLQQPHCNAKQKKH